MKKILLAALLTSASIANATHFNGFYAGLQTGYTFRKDQANLNETYTSNVAGDNGPTHYIKGRTAKKNNNGVMYGALAGWGKNFHDKLYAGVEATVYDDNTSKSFNYTALATDGNAIPFKAQYKRGTVFGVGPRIGVFFNNTWMAYGRLNVEYSRDSITHAQLANSSGGVNYAASGDLNSQKKSKFNLVPALGLEKAFNKIVARVEVAYNPGAKLSQTQVYNQNASSGIYNNTDSQSAKYQSYTLKAGVAYQF